MLCTEQHRLAVLGVALSVGFAVCAPRSREPDA